MKTKIMVLVSLTLCFFLLGSCASVSRFLKIGGDYFEVTVELMPETVATFNVPGHWPRDLAELPNYLYPLSWPVAVWHCEDEAGVKYEVGFSIDDNRVYILLEYATYPRPDDRVFHLFVDGVPVRVEMDKAFEAIQGLFVTGSVVRDGDFKFLGEILFSPIEGGTDPCHLKGH